jgi:hypothetical protein
LFNSFVIDRFAPAGGFMVGENYKVSGAAIRLRRRVNGTMASRRRLGAAGAAWCRLPFGRFIVCQPFTAFVSFKAFAAFGSFMRFAASVAFTALTAFTACMTLTACMALTACTALTAGSALSADEPRTPASVRLNQIQVIGTHNSYHRAPPAALRRWIALAGRGAGDAFDYSHRPLAEQLTQLGVRQIELDVFADPQGGHYKSPAFYRLLRGGKAAAEAEAVAGPDPNAGGCLEAPGLKVFHVQDVDYLSTTPTFAAALTAVRDWSRAHPRHVPILVLVELKDETHGLLPTRPVAFDAERIDEVDREIAQVFAREQALTPDDLRGDEPTLPAALKKRGWPTLESARGKVIFALDNEDRIRDRYLAGRESLRGRWMFTSVPEDHPAAAWFKINDAVRDFDRIQRLVKAGFLVRTRADTGSGEARRNDSVRRDRALASGAQFVSTDYPEPRQDWSEYAVRLPDVPAGTAFRRNPVSD